MCNVNVMLHILWNMNTVRSLWHFQCISGSQTLTANILSWRLGWSAGSRLISTVSCLHLLGHEGDPCLRSSDCSEGYCCARHFWTKICKPVLQQGEVCTKQRKKGSHGLEIFQRCDCAKGLSCKVWKDATSSSKSRLHMCQKIWSGGSCYRRRGLCVYLPGKVFEGMGCGCIERSKRQRLTRDRTDCVGSSSLFGKPRANGIALMCLLWVVHPWTHIQTRTVTHTSITRTSWVCEISELMDKLLTHSHDIQGATELASWCW